VNVRTLQDDTKFLFAPADQVGLGCNADRAFVLEGSFLCCFIREAIIAAIADDINKDNVPSHRLNSDRFHFFLQTISYFLCLWCSINTRESQGFMGMVFFG
jgi:hypothetical protein